MFVFEKVIKKKSKEQNICEKKLPIFSNEVFMFVLTCLNQIVCDINAWDMSITKPCKN